MHAFLAAIFGGFLKKFVGDNFREAVEFKFQELVKGYVQTGMLKHQAYLYIDGLLAEGQAKGASEVNNWFITKRAELKAKLGE